MSATATDNDNDDVEELLCCLEFPELDKTSYMNTSIKENGKVVLDVEVGV